MLRPTQLTSASQVYPSSWGLVSDEASFGGNSSCKGKSPLNKRADHLELIAASIYDRVNIISHWSDGLHPLGSDTNSEFPS